MIITEIDLEIEDIEWYGIDQDGRIGLFMSGGSKAVPLFIRESRENLDIVCDFFEELEITLSKQVLINNNLKIPRKEFWDECKKMSQKGIYCFNISSDSEINNRYVAVCKPCIELNIVDLPLDIQNILVKYKMYNVNFYGNEFITV